MTDNEEDKSDDQSKKMFRDYSKGYPKFMKKDSLRFFKGMDPEERFYRPDPESDTRSLSESPRTKRKGRKLSKMQRLKILQ